MQEKPHAIFTNNSVREDEHVLAQSRRTFPAAGLPDVGSPRRIGNITFEEDCG
jgi:hypothetical protein